MKNFYLDENFLELEDVKEYLKENLKINIGVIREKGFWNSKTDKLKIDLLLEDEVICSGKEEIKDIVYPRRLSWIITEIVKILEKIPNKNEESNNVINQLNIIEDSYNSTLLEFTGDLWYKTYDILKEYLLDSDGFLYSEKVDYGILILCKFFDEGKNPIKSKFKRKK